MIQKTVLFILSSCSSVLRFMEGPIPISSMASK
jgi:hypothetical protein